LLFLLPIGISAYLGILSHSKGRPMLNVALIWLLAIFHFSV